MVVAPRPAWSSISSQIWSSFWALHSCRPSFFGSLVIYMAHQQWHWHVTKNQHMWKRNIISICVELSKCSKCVLSFIFTMTLGIKMVQMQTVPNNTDGGYQPSLVLLLAWRGWSATQMGPSWLGCRRRWWVGIYVSSQLAGSGLSIPYSITTGAQLRLLLAANGPAGLQSTRNLPDKLKGQSASAWRWNWR